MSLFYYSDMAILIFRHYIHIGHLSIKIEFDVNVKSCLSSTPYTSFSKCSKLTYIKKADSRHTIIS